MGPDAGGPPLSRRQVLAAGAVVAFAGAAAAGALALTADPGPAPPSALGVPLPGPVGPERFVLSRDGRILGALSGDTVTVVDTAGPAVLRTVTLPGSADRLVVAPDGARIFAASRDRLSAVTSATGAVTSTITVRGIEGLAVAPDGARLQCSCPALGVLVAVDAATLVADPGIAVAELAGGAVALVGASLVHVGVLGGVAVLDTGTGARSATYGAATPSALLASPDGRCLYVRDGTTVAVVDPATGAFRLRFRVPPGAPVDAVVDPGTGAAVLAVLDGRSLVLVDAASGAAGPARPVAVGDGPATAVRLSGGRAFVAVEDRSGAEPRGAVISV